MIVGRTRLPPDSTGPERLSPSGLISRRYRNETAFPKNPWLIGTPNVANYGGCRKKPPPQRSRAILIDRPSSRDGEINHRAAVTGGMRAPARSPVATAQGRGIGAVTSRASLGTSTEEVVPLGQLMSTAQFPAAGRARIGDGLVSDQ